MSSNSTRTADRRVEYRRVKGSVWPSIVFADRPTCHDCGAPFEPICPTYKCPARRTVLSIMHAENAPEPTNYRGFTPDSDYLEWGIITEAESRRQHVGEVRRPKGVKRGRRNAQPAGTYLEEQRKRAAERRELNAGIDQLARKYGRAA